MCKPGPLVNIKGYICSCVWCQIQNHPCNKIIWFGPISLSPRTIRVCSKRCINLGGCCKTIIMLHTCGFQDFAYQSSLTKLKSTIMQCLDINAQELRHWLSLWVFPIITGAILLKRLHYIINIRLWTCLRETIIHIYHTNQSLRHGQAGIHIDHQKTATPKKIATFHTLGVRLWLDHICFSLIWEQYHLLLYHYLIPGKFSKDWLPTSNICLSNWICEINTLTLKT